MFDPDDTDGTSPATGLTGDLDTVLAGLRAAGEGTRLRIVAALATGELTVSELCRVLGQTQPRVSRHLRLLCEAGLLTRHSEGTNAFYAHTRTGPGRSLLDAIVTLIDPTDRTIGADRQRLAAIREERAAEADRYFEQMAERWDHIRSLHVDDAEVEAALLAEVDPGPGVTIGRLLDIGTGTGRILELLADRVDHGLGIDLSSTMLKVARANLSRKGLGHCTVRQGNVYALDVAPQTIDLAVIHHVLHFLDDPGAAVAEATVALRPGGRLIIIDFAPHRLEHLRTDHAHRRLGFDTGEVEGWCRRAGLVDITVRHLTPALAARPPAPAAVPSGPAAPVPEPLTTSLWGATRPAGPHRTQPPRIAFADGPSGR